jgi:exodeoxyribonuclease V beta subunit
MNKLKELDLKKPPENGVHLVESGAGTGKTYAIGILFCWYTVVNLAEIDTVLVVTFTEAAASELKERILLFLNESFQILSDKKYTSDNEYLDYMCRTKISKEKITLHRLHILKCLKNFDNASIFTIHGFCRKLLGSYILETSSSVASELQKNSQEDIEHFTYRYWKYRFYKSSPLIYGLIIRQKLDQQKLIALYKEVSKKSEALISQSDSTELLTELLKTEKITDNVTHDYKTAQKAWQNFRTGFHSTFGEFESLNSNSYKLKSGYFNELDAIFSEDLPLEHILGKESAEKLILKFSENYLNSKILKKYQEKVQYKNPFFSTCENLLASIHEFHEKAELLITSIKEDYLEYMKVNLSLYKTKHQKLDFDDLLVKVKTAALSPSKSETLKKELRKRFCAVLIDEFQDTDPIQYTIFNELFSTPDRALYLIGDPKQAIYSFRGADIYTYLEAKKNCTSFYSLVRNRRSHPEILKFVNTLFSRKIPFVIPEIEYQDALPLQENSINLLQPVSVKLVSADNKPLNLADVRLKIGC